MVTKNQQIAIDMCINALCGFKNTNDLSSPSHYTIIDEFVFDLEDDILDGTNPELLGESLKDILGIIKNIK